ncbi:MAG TPA: hypothetical protein VJ672_09955 [Gemmatimonadaceae bacterium]|nr:hypothetical protein [Gemmatimonadaceae bacterium]
MRRFAALSLIAFVMACAGTQTPASDTAAASGAVAAPAPAGLDLSQLAGNWNFRGMPENSDSTLLTYVMTATSTREGWSLDFTDRTEAVPLRVVEVSGDSIVTEAGPYSSALRPNTQVTTRTVFRQQDGKLVGRTVARYSGPGVGADTVRIIRQEGTKVQ